MFSHSGKTPNAFWKVEKFNGNRWKTLQGLIQNVAIHLEKRIVPLEFLKQLRPIALPITVRDPHDIDKLRVLRAAGMVIADINESASGTEAVVHELTNYGKIELSIEEDPAN
ncbi:hypothetical protein [Diaphorobacter aerolatus]|uniref:Uncharacterized protein n=1 Tax=Diaphorobacter aerolatus TaxID=1288495 RepID=A0A7H0GLH8_9BURK|nr:hypothetical protein [Diaphorobacter aerolatus]QNP49144.1 hypothetical protein H9K75_03135 [Diaphorobacter aerolatus]